VRSVVVVQVMEFASQGIFKNIWKVLLNQSVQNFVKQVQQCNILTFRWCAHLCCRLVVEVALSIVFCDAFLAFYEFYHRKSSWNITFSLISLVLVCVCALSQSYALYRRHSLRKHTTWRWFECASLRQVRLLFYKLNATVCMCNNNISRFWHCIVQGKDDFVGNGAFELQFVLLWLNCYF